MKAFVKFSPCLYAGEVLCRDCTILANTDDCDMKIGRSLHERTYRAAMLHAAEVADLHYSRQAANAIRKEAEE